MDLDNYKQQLKNIFDSPESNLYFENLRKKQEIRELRFKKFEQDLTITKFDNILQRIINKHDKNYKNKCYNKGCEPCPNNLLEFIFDFVKYKNDNIPTNNPQIDLEFSNIIYEYDKYYFQIVYGQGSFIRIYQHYPELKLIFQI